MTEILTESFCERCGTRYTFETAKPRVRLKGVKVLSRGLRNFVLSDDTSIDEAMAAARNEAERETTAHQLDAFHKTFNFCLSCRQYTCPNCWNAAEARCLSCAPLATSSAIEPDRVEAPAATSAIGGALIDDKVEAEPETWLAPAGQTVEPQAVEPAAVEPAAVDWATGIAAEPEAPATTARDTIGKAAGQTAGLLERFRPGQNLDAELEAFERSRDESAVAEPEAVAVPEMAVAEPEEIEATAEPEFATQAVAEPEPEPEEIEATAEPEPEATAAEAEIEAIEPEAAAVPEAEAAPIAAEPEAGAQPAAQPTDEGEGADIVEQPTWRAAVTEPPRSLEPRHAPDHDTATPVQATATLADPSTRSEPQWPPNPQWPPGAAPAAGLPFLGRPATPQGGIEALWAASNQELVATPPTPGRTNAGIRPCVSCGLSLSATARFCRRCGKLQGG